MTPVVEVRRVRLHEWREVRDLRLEAVGDPDAAIAFLSSLDDELARDEAFWRARTADAALGETAAQFVAIAGDRWVGAVTVLLREAGTVDHLGEVIAQARADVVGVYLAPEHRGVGILDRLFAAAREWALDHGVDALTLDVHADNTRAQTAYRKAGFAATGVTFTSSIGPELQMRSRGR